MLTGKQKTMYYQQEQSIYMKSIFALIHKRTGSLVFLNISCSTAHGVQENQRPHLHGGVSEGIPKAFPGSPHHTVVILTLVLPTAVKLPI